MKLSVTHYSGDRMGGAARAASRLHTAFRQYPLVDSKMLVADKLTDDYTISGLNSGISSRFNSIIKSAIDAVPRRLASPADNMPRSAGWASRLNAKVVNSSSSHIAHLHWINGAFLSVEEIGKITKPIVWTFHDMWPFCGAEHLSADLPNSRWRTGYPPSNNIFGFDIDRWVWRRKKANWQQIIHVVTPSRWLADCVRQSSLMNHFPVHIIPNTLDVNVYKAMNKTEARRLLNLPQNRKLVLFGAIKGTQLTYKGWDLLMPALAKMSQTVPMADAVIFGQSKPENPLLLPLPVHWMGHLFDDFTLAALYSAADVMVVPSRQESFCQTGSEAHACGCPVVAFNATGLRDVVEHGQTGYLAEPYNSDDLAYGIEWVLSDDDRHATLSEQARVRAVRLWSHNVLVLKYLEVYRDAMSQ